MNRMMGLILALTASVVASSCATAGGSGGAGAAVASSGAATESRGMRPVDSRLTREASNNLNKALLASNPEQMGPLLQMALTNATAAVTSEPNNPRGWFLLGQVQMHLKDFQAADSAFTRALQLYPRYEEEIDAEREDGWIMAYNDAIAAYEAGDMDGAIRGMENADLMFKKRPEAMQILGTFYANSGDYAKSIEAFQGALKVLSDPSLLPSEEEERAQWAESREDITMTTGMLLNALNRPAEAEQIYREFLASNPDHLGAMVNLAVSLTAQSKTNEAAEVFSNLSSRADLEERHYMMIGIGLYNVEDYKGASSAFESAAQMNPYSRDAHLNHAKSLWLYAENEEEGALSSSDLERIFEAVIAGSDKVLDLDPYNLEPLALKARAQSELQKLVSNAQVRQRLDDEVKATVSRHEDADFSMEDLETDISERAVSVTGVFRNLKVQPGTSITLRFSALSATGSEIGTKDVTITAPEAENVSPFEVEIPVSQPSSGWKYVLVR